MKTLYEEFRKALDEQDKDRAVEICIKAIDEVGSFENAL